MIFKVSEEQYRRFKKIVIRFIEKRYKDTEFIKIHQHYILRDKNNIDDYVFEITPKRNLIMYDDDLKDIIMSYFGIYTDIIQEIIKEWIEEKFGEHVSNVIF